VIEKAYLPVLVVRAYQFPGKGGGESAVVASGETEAGSSNTGDLATSGASGGISGQSTASGNNIKHAPSMVTATSIPVTADSIYAGIDRIAYHRILLPIDNSRRAECSLPAGISLVQGEKKLYDQSNEAKSPEVKSPDESPSAPADNPETEPTLFLAAVLKPLELPFPAPYPEEIQQLSERFMKVSQDAVRSYLLEIQNRIPVKTETRIVAIHELVETENIDLVVLCAHGKTGRSTWPYGSVARNYIEHGTQPVLVIQDVDRSQVRPTAAEVAAGKSGRR
jgi:nucleotide-binding universal stress UspA family protein